MSICWGRTIIYSVFVCGFVTVFVNIVGNVVSIVTFSYLTICIDLVREVQFVLDHISSLITESRYHMILTYS